MFFILVNLPDLGKYLTTEIPLYADRGVSIFSTGLKLIFTLLCLPQIAVRLPTKWVEINKVTKSWRDNPNQIKYKKIVITKTINLSYLLLIAFLKYYSDTYWIKSYSFFCF